LKRLLKKALQRTIPTRFDPIIVASMGRSGSTLVYDALCDGMAAARFGPLKWFGRRIVGDTAWELSRQSFMPGVVYKTHDLPIGLPRDCGARVVFLFGRASDAAISVLSCRRRYGAAWVAEHFAHMRALGSFDELSERDVLRFEEQIDGWLAVDHARILGLRYETLWKHADDLSRFVGFSVTLPDRRPRDGSKEIDLATAEKFTATYRALDEKIASLADCILRAG
jgi:hypothetical protein